MVIWLGLDMLMHCIDEPCLTPSQPLSQRTCQPHVAAQVSVGELHAGGTEASPGAERLHECLRVSGEPGMWGEDAAVRAWADSSSSSSAAAGAKQEEEPERLEH